MEKPERGWKNVEVRVIRRAGKWISGIVLQENAEGKRRLKLFKGVIKENGSLEVSWKGEKLRISMIQRFNIPSKEYWEKVKGEVEKMLKKIEGREFEEEGEEIKEISLKDFIS